MSPFVPATSAAAASAVVASVNDATASAALIFGNVAASGGEVPRLVLVHDESGAATVFGLGDAPSWIGRAVESLNEVRDRPWLIGGLPVAAPAVRVVQNLVSDLADMGVPEPQIIPADEGAINVEWHRADLDLELLVASDGSVSYSISDPNHGVESEWPEPLTSRKQLRTIASRLLE